MACASRDPASAGSRRVRALTACLGAVLLLSSCRSPFADDGIDAAPTRSADLAVPADDHPASVSADESPAGVDGSAATDPSSPASGPGGATHPPTTDTDAPNAPGPSTPVAVTRLVDQRGDAGGGPSYADALLLAVDDLGDRGRFTVRLAGAVPRVLASEEVMGIGVDVFSDGDVESEYQLFADGGSDGWRAYLQTPDGFVAFPGEFRVGDDLVQFEVPWSSIGGRLDTTVSAFVDWGAPNSLGLVDRSTDAVPDRRSGGILGG